MPSDLTGNVLLFHPGAEIIRSALLSAYPELRADVAADDADFARKVIDAAVVIGQRFDPAPLVDAAALEWLHITLAGVDFLAPVKGALGAVAVTNARGVIADHIANYVIGAIVHLQWDFASMMRNQSARIWKRWATRPLAGQVVCVVGLGTIGREVAKRAAALGMEVIGVRESGRPVPGASKVFRPNELEGALHLADFVVLAVPATPSTAGLMGTNAFHAMKPSAFLINIARGAVIDEAALTKALEHKLVAGACLDVFVEEPLPSSSPLWGFSNVTITPHSSGVTTDFDERNAALIVENFKRYRAGEALRNVVDVAAAL